jgi:hypothetical protein
LRNGIQEKRADGGGGAYLARRCLVLGSLVPERDTLVLESELGPTQRVSVQALEAVSLEAVADDGDARWIRACDLTEARDGEEQVLERVERSVFGRHSREHVCGREETGRAREAQV